MMGFPTLSRLLRLVLVIVLLVPLSGCLALIALNGAGTVAYYICRKRIDPHWA